MGDLFSFDFDAPAPAAPPPATPAAPVREEKAGFHSAPSGLRNETLALVPPEARRLCDGECRAAIANRREAIVPWILMAAWARLHDAALISPALFDALCAELAAEFDAIEHRHKPLIDRAWLAAGTFGLDRAAYPTSVRGAVAHIAWTSWRVALPRD